MLQLVPTKWIKDQFDGPLRRVTDRARTRERPVEAPAAVDANLGPLRLEDMVGLYRSVRKALPERSTMIVEVISANHGEGVSTVARGLAQAAAGVGNARTLICDATPERANFRHYRTAMERATLNDVALKVASLGDAVVDLPRFGVSLCALSDPGAGHRVAVNVELLDPVIALLRQRFDLVVIDAPPANHSLLGLALANKADGVVLVIEAERTRTPIAAATLQSLAVNNGKVLGAVLNKRRFHIPRFIYRWL